jgi:hypothetical protein
MTEATVQLGTLKDTENSQNTLLYNHMLLITKKYIFEKKQKQITCSYCNLDPRAINARQPQPWLCINVLFILIIWVK